MELVKINCKNHKYVIGIDFGHAETSAAICEIEWGKTDASSLLKVSDIRINPSNNDHPAVFVSAICKEKGSLAQIGDNAFSSSKVFENENDGNIVINFKQAPEKIDGIRESLMIDYMRAVYGRIREVEDCLTNDNHVVYIARPSGWISVDTKSIYCQMALNAGIPLAGLMSESRAAIFYAKNEISLGFTKNIGKGAIVVDLGSSTIDFTYIADGEQPIDYGYNHGAHYIEDFMYDKVLKENAIIGDFMKNYPKYEVALRFKLRKIKESIFSTNNNNGICSNFVFGNIVDEDNPDFEDIENQVVKLRFKNQSEFNDFLNSDDNHYMKDLENDLNDFAKNHIPQKKVHGVFLTGGASRMGFVKDVIKDVYSKIYELENGVRCDNGNQSTTISRGIAQLGCADARFSEIESSIINKLNELDYEKSYNKFVELVASNIASAAFIFTKDRLKMYKDSINNLSVKNFQELVKKDIGDINMNVCICSAVSKAAAENCETLHGEIKESLNLYSSSYKLQSLNMEKMHGDIINSELKDNLIDTISNQCSKDFFGVLDIVLVSIFSVPLLIIGLLMGIIEKTKDFFSTPEEIDKRKLEKEKEIEKELCKELDKETREKIYDNFLKNEESFMRDVENKVKESLLSGKRKNSKAVVIECIKKYCSQYVSVNIKNIRIPIE